MGDSNVLTVAKDGSAQYQTIFAALNEVQPGQTIRVLDDAEYSENLTLKRESAFAGITLEATGRAILVAEKSSQSAIHVEGVSGVTIRGFRLRADADRVALVMVSRVSSGTVLEELEFLPGKPNYTAIEFHGCDIPDDSPPLIVRRCRIRRASGGIMILGLDSGVGIPKPGLGILGQWWRLKDSARPR